jgi:hypothetical protein
VEISLDNARAEITRADVAAVLAECLDTPGTAGTTFAVNAGDVAIPEAIAALAASAR